MPSSVVKVETAPIDVENGLTPDKRRTELLEIGVARPQVAQLAEVQLDEADLDCSTSTYFQASSRSPSLESSTPSSPTSNRRSPTSDCSSPLMSRGASSMFSAQSSAISQLSHAVQPESVLPRFVLLPTSRPTPNSVAPLKCVLLASTSLPLLHQQIEATKSSKAAELLSLQRLVSSASTVEAAQGQPEYRACVINSLNGSSSPSQVVQPGIQPVRILCDYEIRTVQTPAVRPNVCFVLSGMGSQYLGMAADLMSVPAFSATINECSNALVGTGINLTQLLCEKSPATEVLLGRADNAFAAITAVQLGLIAALRAAGLEPDCYVGHSLGETVCAYLDGALTLRETIIAAYLQGLSCMSLPHGSGAMAAVEMSTAEFEAANHSDLTIACVNDASSITVAGPTEAVASFVQAHKAQGGLASIINSCGIAFHSKHLASINDSMTKRLNAMAPSLKHTITSKWLSAAVTQCTEFTPSFLASNLMNQVRFLETLGAIPADCVAVEIASHSLLTTVLCRSLSTGTTVVPLLSRRTPAKLSFLRGLTSCFMANALTDVIFDSICLPK